MSVERSELSVERSGPAGRGVFLSYAREDTAAAKRIAEALRGAGVEVWFDQNELVGGDAWDQKIRKQIKECALFVPIVSANTQARTEGYFRLEWLLAAERTRLMGRTKAFLLPVCIDATKEGDADVPESFLNVQWTRLVDGETPDGFVNRVRKLLGVAGVGGQKSEVRGQKSEDGALQPVQGVTPAAEDGGQRARKVSATTILFGAVAVLILGFVGWRWLPRPGGAETPSNQRQVAAATPGNAPSAAAQPPPDFASAKSVAVLPFENLSGDKDNEYFSDGISEELINVLGKVPGLNVAGRTSSFFFKGKQESPAEIARKLGVNYLVSGSVQKVGNQVRIRAQLVKAADGFQLWSSEPMTRDLKDIFAVQDDIAGLIAQNLKLNLGSAPRVAAAVNPEAHRLVLEARFFWAQRTEEGFAKGEKACQRALEIDPQFAPAHAALADVWALRGWWRQLGANLPSAVDFVRAKVEAEFALRLDPMLVEPRATMGGIFLNIGQFAAAAGEFQQAITLNPNYAIARFWHSNLLYAQGNLEAALAELAQAERLDPLFFSMLDSYARTLAYAGRYHEALALNDRALAVRANVPFSMAERAMIFHGLGRKDEAVDAARNVGRNLALEPRRAADGFAIHVLRREGLGAEADVYGTAVLKILPADSYVRGFVLGALGRLHEALPYLELTPPTHFHPLYFSPLWDEVRNDPRWTQLMERLNCAEEYKLARASLARMLRERAAGK